MKKQTNEPFGKPDADGWYEWKGNDMVRPAGMVEITMRDGGTNSGSAAGFYWGHDRAAYDIVKWRPAK